MCTKIQLKEFLEEISAGAKFITFKHISAEIFTIHLKCRIEDGNLENHNMYTKEWIRKFSQFTNTTWIVRNCFPNLKRLVFRKTFWCHRSNQNKSKTSDRTKNLECRAKIDFKIKLINKNTSRNDADLRNGLNMNINIDFNHSHLIHDPECLNQLKCSIQSDSAFYEYFHDGYTPSMAKCYHELRLIEKYGQDSEYIKNASINPNLRHIIYIFQKKRTRKHVDTNDVIDRKIETLQRTGHTVKYNKCHQFVVIRTPLMGRVVTEFSTESILIDVTSIHSGPFVMMVYVPTPLGSLPIVCTIFHERSLVVYEWILLAISSALKRDFNVCFRPKLVSLGNTLLKEAIISMFPRIVVKPDRFEICREFWEFICDDVNKVEKNIRQNIMGLFKSLIYADNIEDAIKIYFSLIKDDIMKPCLQKIGEIWQDADEKWMAVEDFNGKHIEGPIIFIKEFLIQKCKSFSFCVMMDVVTNILESHFQKLTLAYIKNAVIALHTKFLPRIAIPEESILKISPDDFIVPCQDRNKTYHLNTDSLCCDCKVGVKGRICEHLTCVLNVIDYKYQYTCGAEDIETLYKIAGDVNEIKAEIDNGVPSEITEGITTDRPMSASSSSSNITEMKQEVDPLEECRDNDILENDKHDILENHDNDTMETKGHNTMMNKDNTVAVDLKTKYEATMKALNDEFRRLNKLFRDNPNRANMETMTRLAKELAKIRPVEETDFSNIFVQLNS